MANTDHLTVCSAILERGREEMCHLWFVMELERERRILTCYSVKW